MPAPPPDALAAPAADGVSTTGAEKPTRTAATAATAAVVAAGCALLVLRPVLWHRGDPTGPLTLLFVGLLAVGAGWPLPEGAAEEKGPATGTDWRLPVSVLGIGVAAFAAGRLLGGGHPPAPVSVRFVILNSLAAVAEEAFFRRLAYGLLEHGGRNGAGGRAAAGAGLAIVGTSVLFALAHVGVYGWWVAPIDLAAGLVLSWQRWATGSWTVPALTHVVANILVVL